jgi:hypothetical protein
MVITASPKQVMVAIATSNRPVQSAFAGPAYDDPRRPLRWLIGRNRRHRAGRCQSNLFVASAAMKWHWVGVVCQCKFRFNKTVRARFEPVQMPARSHPPVATSQSFSHAKLPSLFT